MTKNELNRDVRRLLRRYDTRPQPSTDSEWKQWEKEQEEMKKEFCRLHDADQEAECFGRRELLILICLNRKLQAVPYHFFLSRADKQAGFSDQ